MFGELWPSVRLSLLSLPRHCAVINRFSDTDKVSSKLEDHGCLDILQPFKTQDNFVIKPDDSEFSEYSTTETSISHSKDSIDKAPSIASQKKFDHLETNYEFTSEYELSKKKGHADLRYVLNADSIEPFVEELYKDNLDAFVPPETVRSQKDAIIEEEIQAISFHPTDFNVDVIPMQSIEIPENLQVFTFPAGDVSRFPQPRAYNQRTGT